MCSKIKTLTSTKKSSDPVHELREALDEADAVVIGAGSGLSSAAGNLYSGPRFEENFKDFIEKYHLPDMYSAGFYPFPDLETFWAYWSRHILLNRYTPPEKNTYDLLLNLVKDKDYFVITTNVDHLFQRSGFDKSRLFYTQGDYGLLQCSVPCHEKIYENEALIRKMVEEQQDMRIPAERIPTCPECGAPMTVNLRKDASFAEDEGWHKAARRYENFIKTHDGKKILFLDLGTGANTPGIIKYPFMRMTAQNPNAIYASINLEDAFAPKEILPRSILIEDDLHEVLKKLNEEEIKP